MTRQTQDHDHEGVDSEPGLTPDVYYEFSTAGNLETVQRVVSHLTEPQETSVSQIDTGAAYDKYRGRVWELHEPLRRPLPNTPD